MTTPRAFAAALTVCCVSLIGAPDDKSAGPCDSILVDLTRTQSPVAARDLYTCAIGLGPQSELGRSYYEKLKGQGVQPYAASAANNLAVRKLNVEDFAGAKSEAEHAIEALDRIRRTSENALLLEDDRAIQSDLRLNLGRALRGMKKCGPGLQRYAEGLQRARILEPRVADEALSFTRECADPSGLPVPSWLSLEDSIALALRSALGDEAALKYTSSLIRDVGVQEKPSVQRVREAGLIASLAAIYSARPAPEPGEPVDVTIPGETGKTARHAELDDVLRDIKNAFTGSVWSNVAQRDAVLEKLPYAAGRIAQMDHHPFILHLLLVFEQSDQSYYDRVYLHTLSRILLRQGRMLVAQPGGPSDSSFAAQGLGCLMAAWWIDNSNSEAARLVAAYLPRTAEASQRGDAFEHDVLDVDRTQKLSRGLRAYLGARADEPAKRIGPAEFSDIVETLSYINQRGAVDKYRVSPETLLRMADETTKSVAYPIPDVLMTLAGDFKSDPDRAADLYRRATLQYAQVGQEAAAQAAYAQWQALRPGKVPNPPRDAGRPVSSTGPAEVEMFTPLVEGDVVIRGKLTRPSEDDVTLLLEIRESFQCNPQLPEDRLLKYRQRITLRRGQMEFYFVLPRRLVSGQEVFVRDEGGKFAVEGSQEGIVVTSMVREEFSNVRIYASAAANLDGKLFPRLSATSVRAGIVPRIDATGACGQPWLGLGLSTYTDFRIEPLSVTAIAPGSARIGGTTRPGYGVETGAFMPMLLRHVVWRLVDKTIGAYIGPLAKVGLEGTITGPVPNQLNPGPFYYRAFGIRTGYAQYFPTASAKARSTAPLSLVSLDITAGRWDRFAYLNDRAIRVPWRLGLSATLTVPKFPVWVGGSLNFATSGPQVSEIRAYVGVKIEVARDLTNLLRKKRTVLQ